MRLDVTLRGIFLGPLEIRFYSLAILTGLLAGVWLAQREARRQGQDPTHVVNIAVLGAIFGIIGARLYHVLDAQNIRFYLQEPARIFQVWNGGIGIFGATAGAAIALVVYARVRRLDMLRWFDIGAPAFLLGQAIGRWGNFFNQELFGGPTTLPWSIPIDPINRPFRYPAETFPDMRFHPLFLYESLLSFAGVAVLLYVSRRFAGRLRPGDILLCYLMWYPASRFMLEFLRLDPWKIGAIPMAQIVSAALFLGAVVLLVLRHRGAGAPEPALAADAAAAGRSRAAQKRRARRRSGDEPSLAPPEPGPSQSGPHG